MLLGVDSDRAAAVCCACCDVAVEGYAFFVQAAGQLCVRGLLGAGTAAACKDGIKSQSVKGQSACYNAAMLRKSTIR
jgi:hypothetical protein